jgi:hypothetical protein
MRRACLTLIGLMAAATAVRAEDCTKDVLAAFEKQRTSKAFRVSMTQPSAEGPVDMTVDYIPPNKMLQTVKSAAMAGDQQTMLVGDRAFAGSSGSFEELLPQFTQSIVAEVNSALGAPPANLGQFECLGKTGFEGKDYLAFRSTDKNAQPGTDPGAVLARTIYVDSENGLPAFNVVAAVSGKADPVLKATYSYPTDIVIEAPEHAPVQKYR